MEVDEKLLENVITGDKLWVFQYDPETKQQSHPWKSVSSPRLKKARMQCSQVKVMLITFFDNQEMVHHEFVPQRQTVNQHFYKEVPQRQTVNQHFYKEVPQRQTVNQHFYKEVLTRLVNKIRQKQRASWAGKTWILHHDNAHAHTALSVKQFLVSK